MKAKEHDWVEIAATLLEPDQRAPGLPEDTAHVPYTLRTRGFLTEPAAIGDTVTIKTITGRLRTGSLKAINPTYEHTFGDCIPELPTIRQRIRQEVGEVS